MSAPDLDPGTLLIAPPMLQDPNFRRTVVLLCEHGPEGSFGLILNRPLDLQLNEVMEGYLPYDDQVCLGGPVQRNTLHFVHRMEAVHEGVQLPNGVQWGGRFETIKSALQQETVTAQELRFFIGYAGWSPGQLEDELEADGWILSTATPDLVFTDEPEELWRTALRQMGGEYAILANFPEDPRMN